MTDSKLDRFLKKACRELSARLIRDGQGHLPLEDYEGMLIADTWQALFIHREASLHHSSTCREEILKAAAGRFSVSRGTRSPFGDVERVILTGRNIPFVVDFPFADTPMTDDFGFVYPQGHKPGSGHYRGVHLSAAETVGLMEEFDRAVPQIRERAKSLRLETLRTVSLKAVNGPFCTERLKDTLGAAGIPYSLRMDGQDAMVTVSLGKEMQLAVRIPPEKAVVMTGSLMELVESTRKSMERFGHPYTVHEEERIHKDS